MYMKNELDSVLGVYKCYGDVDNLKFKVRLEIIKSSMIPLSSIEDQDSGLDPQYYEREELEFGWNEKLFSDRELELYKDEKNCTSNLELEYHRKIEALASSIVNSPSRRLFTYSSKDRVPEKLYRNVLYNEDGNRSFFDEIVSRSFLHRKLNSVISSERYENRSALPVKNLVDFNPSEIQRQENRSLSPNFEVMYVVADLSDKSKTRKPKDYECMDYLLFTITWNKRTSTLSVMPDFAAFNTAGYKIDVDNLSDTRYVYRYWLLNISPTEEHASRTENLNEQAMIRQNLNFSVDFELPPKNTCHLFAFIELQKIEGFPAEKLFVQYFIDLPSKWRVEKSDSLYGMTPQCRPKKNSAVTSFSCVFEVKLTQEIIFLEEETHESQNDDVPQLFFEVCSLDSWRRFRVEGYASMPFPTSSGYHKIVLDSWRPYSSNRRQQLRRFFIGGDYEIADVEYCGIASDSNILARYGFESISTGSIHLVVNSVRQTCPTGTRPKKMMYSLNSWKTNNLINNVNNILEAFKKARQRMLSVREPISGVAAHLYETSN